MAAACVLQALFQAHGLDGEDFLTAAAPLSLIVGHKGRRVHGPQKRSGTIRLREGKLHHLVVVRPAYLLPGREGSHPAALLGQTFQVQVRINGLVDKPAGLGQAGAVLRDQVLAAEHQILGGLPLPGVGVHITADQAGGLAADQLSAVGVLAGGLIAGRAVDHHRGPGHAVADAGRTGNPHVLADLRPNHQARGVLAGEQKVGAHGHRPALPHCLHRNLISRAEVAGLIELLIVGQVGFRHKTQKLPVLHRGRYVVQLAAALPGQPHKNQHVLPGRSPDHLPKRLQCAVQQRLLREQVAAGVGGKAQLREHHKLGALFVPLLHQPDDLLPVKHGVGHPDLGCRRCDTDKSISHIDHCLHLSACPLVGTEPARYKSSDITPALPASLRGMHTVRSVFFLPLVGTEPARI